MSGDGSRAFAVAGLSALLCVSEAAYADETSAANERAFDAHDDAGFKLETPDGASELRIFGIVQTDFRDYLRKRDRTDYERFLVRRARPYLEGHVMRDFDFRLMMDFGNGEVDLLDAFVDARLVGKMFRVRVGKYKQPFSYEQFRMEDLTLAVFERSALDILAPARNVGAMIHGTLGDGRLEYAAGVSNGLRDSDFEEKRNEKDFVGRAVAQPLPGFHVGISAAYGEETDAFDPAAFSTPMRVPYFEFAEGVNAAGERIRTSPEAALFLGPWAVASQYLEQRQRVQNAKADGAPSVVVPMHAFYLMTSVVLTGERRTSYAEFIHPKHPVRFHDGWRGTGAFELVLRTSEMKIDRVVFDASNRLAAPDEVSNRLNEISVGLNWYLSRWIWVVGNFEHAWFGRSLPLGGASGARLSNQQSIGLRTTIMW